MSLSKVVGSLVGVALGDAMGMPSELWSRKKVKERFGKITEFLPGPDDHFIVKGFKAGEFTDDTSQAIKICQSIIKNNGKIEAASIAYAILEWAEENDAFNKRYLGPSSEKALRNIQNGVPVEEAGGMGDTNGAAMRIAPIGMISKSEDITALVDNVEEASKGTHNTNIAIAGAAMLAAAISTAIDTDNWNTILENAFKAYDVGMNRGNDTYGASSKVRLKLALEWIDNGDEEEVLMDKLYNIIGAGVATTEAVPTAIALAYYAKGDPMKGTQLAASLGGDCDTIGAMTGGLCGAYSGIEAIPLDIVEQLETVNNVNLRELAERLYPYRR
ncbi:MAG TPA: ADP-ribosylglycohydrolase family protein [Bacillus sp. (in: firmicutes)]|uniref:ADP-ribosylglycohydrolase family protein n=1 Tax=Bacillus litorisediminis TaxID=2922713 RepID=UPI001FADC081|nr:ADP-ribosylglycohydrolase family protein [Bacillus litorisediminis]HWO78498.1 ADP-ribosylglycohydrolase family protein [Bacillus sp. (in: firmicutes)]